MRRVGKANGSRERAPDDRLRVPTIQDNELAMKMVGTARSAPLPTLRAYSAGLPSAAARIGDMAFHENAHASK
jgi:hypothetical protein